MDLTILPLKIVIFQILILLVAIATEALVFKFQLKMPPKTAVEYAAFINLLSACAGWSVFLSIFSFLPEPFLDRVMIYMVFGNKTRLSWEEISALLIVFLLSLLFKLIGLQLGEFIWEKKPDKDAFKIHLHMEDLKNRQSIMAIAGHLCSHLFIVLIWLIQSREL